MGIKLEPQLKLHLMWRRHQQESSDQHSQRQTARQDKVSYFQYNRNKSLWISMWYFHVCLKQQFSRFHLFTPTFLFIYVQRQTEAVTRTANCDQRAKASSCTTTRCRTALQRARRLAGIPTPNQRRWAAKIDSSRTEPTTAPAPTSPVSPPTFKILFIYTLNLYELLLEQLIYH